MTDIASLVSDRVWELSNPLLELGESLTLSGGVNAMNDACDVSLFSMEDLLSLLLEDKQTRLFHFLPFCFWYQTIANTHFPFKHVVS
jgi:hypothetical protein